MNKTNTKTKKCKNARIKKNVRIKEIQKQSKKCKKTRMKQNEMKLWEKKKKR